jgi:hypothetical protein
MMVYPFLVREVERYGLQHKALEANPVVLHTGIRNGDEPDLLVAGADVGDVDTEQF